MPTAKSATNIPSPKRTPTRKKNGHARAVLPLTWSATEYVPQKRWWWYVTFGYIVITVALLLHAVGNWSAALVTFAIGATIFILYLAKPRVWTYTLQPQYLEITSGKRTLNLPLEQFCAFTTEEIVRGKDREPYVLIVLLPQRKFAVSRDVYLTQDEGKNLQIAKALDGVVPFAEEPPYRLSMSTVDRLARWLRLN